MLNVMFLGEILSLIVAVSWTVTAICFEYAGRRIGALSLNIIRLLMAVVMLAVTLKLTIGSIAPWNASLEVWLWLLASGLVGYVFGDYCLLNAYLLIGSRFGQLFMTLAPPVAAIADFILLGEQMSIISVVGMIICLIGIAISVIHGFHLDLPLKGILFAVGGSVGQGLGLVLSKMGINSFILENSVTDAIPEFIVPFAATQIRSFAGIFGFLIIIVLRKKLMNVCYAFTDKNAMIFSLFGTFFGPFVGVSLSLMALYYISVGVASTIMALTPIIIMLPSKYIFKEKITLRQILGAVISIIGVALFFL